MRLWEFALGLESKAVGIEQIKLGFLVRFAPLVLTAAW